MTKQLKNQGINHVQLEVKCSNTEAQNFYRKRGMEIIRRIDLYYKTEHGYMMRGNL
jgi:ribosomal protein S18 acetylase RimI-like enzyme